VHSVLKIEEEEEEKLCPQASFENHNETVTITSSILLDQWK
jgi:hypothetical protein